MNVYAFLSLFSFLINFFTLTYILALRRHSAVNRAYLIFAILLAVWSCTGVVLASPIRDLWFDPLLKISSITWIMMGFCLLNFTYAFLKKPKDVMYYAAFILSSSACVVNISTNLIANGYRRYPWGAYPQWQILFPIVSVIIFLSILYSIYLIYTHKKTDY